MNLEIATAAEEPVEGGALVDHLHEVLRRSILECELAPDSVISQVQLAKRFGISRTPLREVLRLLEREGLVEARHNRRVRITGFSEQDFVEIHASRIVLETLATRQSMQSMTPATLVQLRSDVEAMREAAGQNAHESWQVAHRRFHGRLTIGGGRRLGVELDQLTDHADRYRRIYATRAPLAWHTGLRQHEEILAAASGFDVDGVAEAVARHLARAALTTLRVVNADADVSLIQEALRMATGSAELH